jgi:hypothetical protein
MIYHEMRRFFRICQLSYRHAITSWYFTRYGVFSGYADYLTDMRNTNDGIDLWPIQISDYPADMRKSNGNNDLGQTPVLATWVRAVRARRRLENDEKSRSGDDVFDDCPVYVGQAEVAAGVTIRLGMLPSLARRVGMGAIGSRVPEFLPVALQTPPLTILGVHQMI